VLRLLLQLGDHELASGDFSFHFISFIRIHRSILVHDLWIWNLSIDYIIVLHRIRRDIKYVLKELMNLS
jgi:hypothetical protein